MDRFVVMFGMRVHVLTNHNAWGIGLSGPYRNSLEDITASLNYGYHDIIQFRLMGERVY